MARGTLYLMLANALFAVVGYVIHFGLGRHLGPEDYGTFGVVLYLMTTVNLFITSGIPRSASKHIAEDNSRLPSIIAGANRIQLVFCIVIFCLYLGLAGVIANLLNDASLTPYIRVSALAVPAYALYSVYNDGYLNGLRRFGRQAISTTVVSLAKATLVFTLVWVGMGINGAITGYIVSAFIGFIFAWRFLGTTQDNNKYFDWKKLLTFAVPVTLFAAAFFILMSVDLFAVKALLDDNASAGYYTAAATISKVPYYLFAGLAMTLLPSVSKALSANDVELARSYIQQSMRYMLMLLIPVVLLLSATASDLLTLVYSSRYIPAATPLAILAFGAGLLSIFFVLAHIIMGSGKPWAVLMIALIMVIMSIGLNVWLVPRFDLTGAAWATTATGITGLGLAATYILHRFKALVPPLSLLRICLASLAVYFIALYVPVSFAWLPLFYLGLLALFAGMLILTRELTIEDLSLVKSIIPGERLTGGDSTMP
jgi:O-antigen/teichoic acid export membrane protein